MKKKDLKIGNETRISILYARITRVHHLSKDDCNLWERLPLRAIESHRAKKMWMLAVGS